MNQYYANTDESNIYCIVMVLHPGLKLAYFKKQRWPQDWIDTSKSITRDEYQTYVGQ
ncbi:hypothetical protein B0H10DRAFT_1797659 [Mycena sp. CBHHK59/15]|nr:hypothetical protein B0H10DRAFT_1797659 [Mycena sp. CBHHK59/15]